MTAPSQTIAGALTLKIDERMKKEIDKALKELGAGGVIERRQRSVDTGLPHWTRISSGANHRVTVECRDAVLYPRKS